MTVKTKKQTGTPDLPAAVLRLHQQTTEAALFKRLVQEAAACLGAQRLLLVSLASDEPSVIAARVPRNEDVQALVQAVLPWLREAQASGASCLRYGPHGAASKDQRSCLVVPLVAGRDISVVLYADIDGRRGRFEESEHVVLDTLATHATLVLAHVRDADKLRLAADARAAESLATQAAHAATVDVLQVIGSSRDDPGPVFDKILECSEHLLSASSILLGQVNDAGMVELERMHWTLAGRAQLGDATVAQIEVALRAMYPVPLAGSVAEMVFKCGEPIQWRDVLNGTDVPPFYRLMAQRTGVNYSVLIVPLFWQGQGIGTIGLTRNIDPAYSDTLGFSPQEQALVKTFADQAVIAIQNARLFRETQEALQRQTASADILRVISRSPTDVQPVFDAIVETAISLITCDRAVFILTDETDYWVVARADASGHRGVLDHAHVKIDPEANFPSRVIRDKTTIHQPDWSAIELPPHEQNVFDKVGIRSSLTLPLLRDGRCFGLLGLLRTRTGAFDAREIALAESFCDQAMIAIENTRLFNETQEALERQTATANVLKAISRTTFDLGAVLDTLIGTAARLCHAWMGVIFKIDGDFARPAGLFGATPALIEHLAAHPIDLRDRQSVTARAVAAGSAVQVEDTTDRTQYGRGDVQQVGGYRTLLAMPILREGVAIGVLTLGRPEVKAFNDKEIELVTSFADQAAIAMENVRLFNETQEALQRETASADILRVISSSPTDVQPVFDAIVGSTVRLIACDRAVILRCDDAAFWTAASADTNGLRNFTATQRIAIDTTANFPSQVIRAGTILHLPDWSTSELPEHERKLRESIGVQSSLMLPLQRAGSRIGVLALMRMRVSTFSDKEIALAESFRDQAMIAIENTRLFNETQEALEQQTASAAVLGVISNSVSDTAPVFEAIVQSCQKLFGGNNTIISLVDDDGMVRHEAIAAQQGWTSGEVRAYLDREFPRPLAQSYQAYPIRKRQVVHYPDMLNGPKVPEGMRQMARDMANYSMLIAPMLWEGRGIGTIHVSRIPPTPFTEKESGLLRTFADQAVIAIQNARLFNETQEALQRETAGADILRVISSSPTDVQPVFDAIVSSAIALIDCDRVVMGQCDAKAFWSAASADKQGLRSGIDRSRIAIDPAANFPSRVIRDKTTLHLPDWSAVKLPLHEQKLFDEIGIKACLMLPLLRHGECVGTLNIIRLRYGAFSAKEIALAESFRDQAMIAIENTRLFNETQEALEQQTASAEVLEVIGSSVADTQPVFDKILESCRHLFGGTQIGINLVGQDGNLWIGAYDGPGRAELERLQPFPAGDASGSGAAIVHRRVMHYPDASADEVPPVTRNGCKATQIRSVLFAPMLWEGQGIGTIFVGRDVTGPFSDKAIALLRTFCDQAVIAIQNARLFRETNEALERQTATAEILKVIAGSPDDVQPVFDAIAASSNRLLAGFSTMVARIADDMLHLVAFTPTTPQGDAALRAFFPARMTQFGVGESIRNGRIVQIDDAATQDNVADDMRQVAKARGWRSAVFCPLVRGAQSIGMISVTRREPGSFSPHQVQLLQTFADQAVIAIENVRLFNETKEALEQQTATSEVLQVISRSTFDLDPVFRTLVESAVRLCGAQTGMIFRQLGGVMHLAASDGPNKAFMEYVAAHPIAPGRGSATGRAVLEGSTVHILDVEADPEYAYGGKALERYRSIVAVPLLRDGKVMGVFALWRHHVEAFTPRQIALVETFADQAVIAIENVRLFNETQESLERQTATAEILNVIASSPEDVQPVLDAIVHSACKLIGGFSATLLRLVNDMVHCAAYTKTTEAGDKTLLSFFPAPMGSDSIYQPLLTAKPYIVEDTEAAEGMSEGLRKLARNRGWRSQILVPLLHEGAAVGVISVTRSQPGGFSDHQFDLLRTFADQAVIAIQNTRLFNDTKEALEQQTATAEVLEVISGSVADAKPVSTRYWRVARSCSAARSRASCWLATTALSSWRRTMARHCLRCKLFTAPEFLPRRMESASCGASRSMSSMRSIPQPVATCARWRNG